MAPPARTSNDTPGDGDHGAVAHLEVDPNDRRHGESLQQAYRVASANHLGPAQRGRTQEPVCGWARQRYSASISGP